MKLLADESVDGPIVVRLRDDGHTVLYVAEMDPGLPDDAVLALANRDGMVLLTADKDFGELVFRQRRTTAGIVLIRLAGLPAHEKAATVSAAIHQHGMEFGNAFSVIARRTVRLRRALS